MQSNGGLAAATEFQGKDAVLSGPAGGVVGAVRTAEAVGEKRIIAFDMGGTYSHAFSQQLGTIPCSNQSLVRRFISGSNAYDVSFGATFCSWYDGFISLYGVYDRIQYTRKYFPKIEINGFGGGARIYQPLSCDFDLTAYIEIRQPYNYYEGDLNFRKDLLGYDAVFGLFASYTDVQSR